MANGVLKICLHCPTGMVRGGGKSETLLRPNECSSLSPDNGIKEMKKLYFFGVI